MPQWKDLDPRLKLATIEEFQRSIEQETAKMVKGINELFALEGAPLRLEVDIRLVVTQGEDPRRPAAP